MRCYSTGGAGASREAKSSISGGGGVGGARRERGTELAAARACAGVRSRPSARRREVHVQPFVRAFREEVLSSQPGPGARRQHPFRVSHGSAGRVGAARVCEGSQGMESRQRQIESKEQRRRSPRRAGSPWVGRNRDTGALRASTEPSRAATHQ